MSEAKAVLEGSFAQFCSFFPGSTVFGGGGKVNVESWRCVSTLRGHAGDVLDLAWSPHDAWLATCSVDNTVIIWNALNMTGQP
jgi:protein HIRA/HIR1